MAEACADQFFQFLPKLGLGACAAGFLKQCSPGRANVFVGSGVGPGDGQVGVDDSERDIDLRGDVATASRVGGAGGQTFRWLNRVADAPVVDEAVEFLALADGKWFRAVEALDADDMHGAVRVAPLGGDDVVDAVRSQVVVAEFRTGQVGGVAGGVEDDGAPGGTFFEQLWQGVEAAEVVPVLADGGVAVAVGDQAVTAVRMHHEHAARLGAQHVGDMCQPVGGVGGHGRAAKATKSL